MDRQGNCLAVGEWRLAAADNQRSGDLRPPSEQTLAIRRASDDGDQCRSRHAKTPTSTTGIFSKSRGKWGVFVMNRSALPRRFQIASSDLSRMPPFRRQMQAPFAQFPDRPLALKLKCKYNMAARLRSTPGFSTKSLDRVAARHVDACLLDGAMMSTCRA